MSFRPPRTLPVISIFHNASSPPSLKALSLLRKASTEPYPSPPHNPLSFELNVSENPPTSDQFRTMQRYYGRPISTFLSAHPTSAGSETGSGDEVERVVKTAEKNRTALKYPLVVDWDGGKVAVGDLSEVQKILDARLKARNDASTGGNSEGGEKKGWFSGLFGSS